MSSVIKVENLSKKYVIGHQKQASYETLSEKITHCGRSISQRIRHPFSNNNEEGELEEFWALKDINFEIQQGDRVGIIGRNGAGKSTLLKILSRITAPTTGKITLDGRVASLLEVGTGFHPELTGRENIFLNGAVLGMRKAEIHKKFDEIVDFAEVEKFLDTPVKRYSSGMYVRLAFAVAAHLEPEILIVDEVLAVGDVQFQKKCLGKMDDAAKQGRTVLFVSHNMKAIKLLCNTAILIQSGMVSQMGDVQSVINQNLQIDQDKSSKKVWDKGISNKDVDELKVLSICVLGEDKKNKPIIQANENFKIKINFKMLEKISKFRIGFLMTTLDGIEVVESYHFVKTDSIGVFEAVCCFPSKVFNSGIYFLSLNVGIPNVKNLVYIDRAIKFEIVDITKTSDFGAINHRGILNPELEWVMKNVK